MASVSKEKTKRIVESLLIERYSESYKKKTGKTARNWNHLAEAIIFADIERAHTSSSALRTKQFSGIPKQSVLDRLVASPFKLFEKRKGSMYVKCERDGSARFSPDSKEEALDIEREMLDAHIVGSKHVRALVLSILSLPSHTTISEIRKHMEGGPLSTRINLYNKIYRQIVKADLKAPDYEYYDLHYESGSDRYFLSKDARQILRKAYDESQENG